MALSHAVQPATRLCSEKHNIGVRAEQRTRHPIGPVQLFDQEFFLFLQLWPSAFMHDSRFVSIVSFSFHRQGRLRLCESLVICRHAERLAPFNVPCATTGKTDDRQSFFATSTGPEHCFNDSTRVVSRAEDQFTTPSAEKDDTFISASPVTLSLRERPPRRMPHND